MKEAPLLVCFPVDEEAKALRGVLTPAQRKWELSGFDRSWGAGRRGECEVVWACVGMGVPAVQERMPRLLKQWAPRAVLLAGFAGGLDPKLKWGDVVVSAGLSGAGIWPSVPCATVREIVGDPGAKAQVRARTAADICDMEWDAVREASGTAGIPAMFMRVILDGADDRLPVEALAHAIDARTHRPTPLRLVGHFVRAPWDVPAMMRVVRRVRRAGRVLARELPRGIDAAVRTVG